jgi:gamma-glutamylcyclotransferase (GGCT)/AIG2-like uncharacterized protein YtfP
MPHHLFVYGTLHPDRAPAEIAATVRQLTLIGPGTIRGRLYDLGDYPGVVIHPTHNEEIPGEIFALPEDPAALTTLDRYEDFRPTDPVGSLFIRSECTVALPDGNNIACWIYLYNR